MTRLTRRKNRGSASASKLKSVSDGNTLFSIFLVLHCLIHHAVSFQEPPWRLSYWSSWRLPFPVPQVIQAFGTCRKRWWRVTWEDGMLVFFCENNFLHLRGFFTMHYAHAFLSYNKFMLRIFLFRLSTRTIWVRYVQFYWMYWTLYWPNFLPSRLTCRWLN